MDNPTRFALNGINKRFYCDFSEAFSDTRSRPWPGWSRVIARPSLQQPGDLPEQLPLRILDVGCGNGRFALFLKEGLPVPFSYCGIDASPNLLAIAQLRLECHGIREVELLEADLVEVGLPEEIENRKFDLIVVFGILHHLPGFAERVMLLRNLSCHLSLEGLLALSFWQFGSEPRFERRVRPWSDSAGKGCVEVDPRRLEEGDVLLAWGSSRNSDIGYDRESYRYCHHASDIEIDQLLTQLDLRVEDSYRSDGAGNALNRYEILRSRP